MRVTGVVNETFAQTTWIFLSFFLCVFEVLRRAMGMLQKTNFDIDFADVRQWA